MNQPWDDSLSVAPIVFLKGIQHWLCQCLFGRVIFQGIYNIYIIICILQILWIPSLICFLSVVLLTLPVIVAIPLWPMVVIVSVLPVVVVCNQGHIWGTSVSWRLMCVAVDKSVVTPALLPSWPLGCHVGQPIDFSLLVPEVLYLHMVCSCSHLESFLLLLGWLLWLLWAITESCHLECLGPVTYLWNF